MLKSEGLTELDASQINSRTTIIKSIILTLITALHISKIPLKHLILYALLFNIILYLKIN